MDRSLKLNSSLFGKLSVFFILTSLLFNFIIEGFFEITLFRKVFLLIALAFFALRIALNTRVNIIPIILIYYSSALVILFVSIFFWSSYSQITVYISPILALIVITTEFSFFKKLLIYITYLILFLAIYEYLIKDYIFTVSRETDWGFIPLDEKFYGGLSQIFRAKALFEGPLALAQFAIGISLIFKDKIKIIIIAIILSLLANGRLGLIVSSGVLILHIIEYYNLVDFLKKKKVIISLAIIIVSSISAFFYFLSQKAILRILESLNLGSTSNDARLGYWAKAVDYYIDYDFFNKIFGKSGYFREAVGNSAENGWLMLLLDNGLIGFMYYFLPLFVISTLSFEYRRIYYGHMFLLFVSMFIQTFHMGALAAIFYWIIIYSFYQKIIKA